MTNPAYINDTPTGDVFLRDFDKGIIESLGAVQSSGDYFLSIPQVQPPPYPHDFRDPSLRNLQMPGIKIIWASPDDRVDSFELPCIVIRRETVELALERWPSIHLAYRAPAPGAVPVVVERGNTTLNGYNKYEEKEGGYPYNITYLISALASGKSAEAYAIRMIHFIMRAYKPRMSYVTVTDSLGAERTYDVYAEGPDSLAEALDIVDRQRGYSINVRVEGELDQNDPYITTAATDLDFDYHNGLP